MKWKNLKGVLLSYGFFIVVIIMVFYFSLATKFFLSLANIMGLLHAAVPLAITASGLAFVIMTGKLDISIGSTSYLAAAVGCVLMLEHQVPPWIGFPVILSVGLLAGAINGLFVVYFKVNPFITTMGTMFIFKGIALNLARERLLTIPSDWNNIGNFRWGPVYFDILICAALFGLLYVIQAKTVYGRKIMALGNSEDVAGKVGVNVKRISFLTFVVSGLLASLGGICTMLQLGSVSLTMGQGLEFSAIAVIVIGGISLFGGEGSIFGVIFGVLTFQIIENGLTHLGSSPYIYPFVRGGIIFVAMYADTLKQRQRISKLKLGDLFHKWLQKTS